MSGEAWTKCLSFIMSMESLTEKKLEEKNGITSFPLRWFRKTKFSGLAQKAKADLLSFTLQLHYSSALFIFEFQFYNTENEDSVRA